MDFTIAETESLLQYLGYKKYNKGKTSGSRIMYFNKENKTKILLHKPHPNNELKEYQIKQLIKQLERENLL